MLGVIAVCVRVCITASLVFHRPQTKDRKGWQPAASSPPAPSPPRSSARPPRTRTAAPAACEWQWHAATRVRATGGRAGTVCTRRKGGRARSGHAHAMASRFATIADCVLSSSSFFFALMVSQSARSSGSCAARGLSARALSERRRGGRAHLGLQPADALQQVERVVAVGEVAVRGVELRLQPAQRARGSRRTRRGRPLAAGRAPVRHELQVRRGLLQVGRQVPAGVVHRLRPGAPSAQRRPAALSPRSAAARALE